MRHITIQTIQGTFHVYPLGKSIKWTSIGMQALCTVHSEPDGGGHTLGAFINPVSVEGLAVEEGEI